MKRREAIDDAGADLLEQMPDPVEQRHQCLEGENTKRGKPIGSREREQFRNQIAKQNDDREDHRGCDPLRDARRERAFPEQEETEDDKRNVHERIAEEENVEYAPRIFAKDLDELFERRMLFLEPPELMGLEGEERGL